MTFADFAITEARFRKHFRNAPRNTWNDKMVLLTDFLNMDAEDREGKYPFIWAVDRKNQLSRVLVAKPIVESCEERRDFWILLRDLSGAKKEVLSESDLESKVRAEVVSKIAQKLMKLAGGNGEMPAVDALVQKSDNKQSESIPQSETGLSPWLETEECTSCDECININSKVFAYNSDKKAIIKDPQGGSYQDLVLAAEKCTAQVIHPGLPVDQSGKDIEKWLKRGEKFN